MTVRDPASIECQEVVELVSDFLDDAMTPDDRARLEQHLLVCPPCTSHVAQVKATIAHFAELRDEPADASAALDLFRHWAQKRADDGDA